jgi:hypothetical protein
MTAMRGGNLKLAALLGLGALWLLVPAFADPSDDLAGPSASQGGGTTDTGADFNNIEIVDASIEAKLEIARIGSRRGANHLLSVFAGLRNKTNLKLDLEIETIYKDKSGNELNTGSWIHFTLAPHAEQDYRSSAISEGAVDFLIRVRHARSTASTTH